MEHNTRTHRTGSITAGLSMIIMGVLFVLHLFFDMISYEMIFRLWPFIIILLGIEILIANFLHRKFIYDKGAVFLIILISLLAAVMADADWCLTNLDGCFINI